MSPERWQRLRELFRAAEKLPPDDRAPWLDTECADDPELAAEVLRLLAASPDDDRDLEAIVQEAAEAAREEGRPQREAIGPYRIEGILGEGGMGAVWLAGRTDPGFRQQVAIKIVGSRHAGDRILSRFRAERQILANLQHPYIARLLDGGETDDGVPYFVMEYVDGRHIADYCRGRPLRERLSLFLKVCEAVEYAHRNLVIHRDIKPSNILVNAAGEPRLLDFGIAKLLEDEAEDTAALTRAGLRLMTPEYASPEQVRGAPVSTATDVYGLGILLYELVSGRPPFDRATTSYGDWPRIICETEPEPPSRAVLRGDVHTEDAPPDRKRLDRLLRGDLDNIVMKAIRKEPERRYTSVHAMAADVEAYLADRPVSARPDTLTYRARKFARRHPLGLAAGLAAAVVAVLAVSFHVATVAAERDRARLEASKATAVAAFLTGLFREADPNVARGRTVSAVELLERGRARIARELRDAPEIRARMLAAIGESYFNMTDYREARDILREAVAVTEARYGPAHPETAEVLSLSGRAEERMADYAAAAVLHERALAVFSAVWGEDSPRAAEELRYLAAVEERRGDAAAAEALLSTAVARLRAAGDEGRAQLARALQGLAGLLRDANRHDEEERALRESLALRRALYGDLHPDVSDALTSLGLSYLRRGRYPEAREHLEQALAMRRELFGDDSVAAAYSLNNLSSLCLRVDELEQSERLAREALAIFRIRLGEDHPNYAYQLGNLANTLLRRGRREEAFEFMEESAAVLRRIFGEEHREYGHTLSSMGGALIDMERYPEAVTTLETALEVLEATLGEEHYLAVNTRSKLGRALIRLGDYDRAGPLLERSLALAEAGGEGMRRPRTIALDYLGEMQLAAGRPVEAEARFRELTSALQAMVPEESAEISWAIMDVASALRAQGRNNEALQLLESRLAFVREHRGEDDPDTRRLRERLASYRNYGDS